MNTHINMNCNSYWNVSGLNKLYTIYDQFLSKEIYLFLDRQA